MARRRTEATSMAFLDVICCGFGAVVLFYTIISAQAGLERSKANEEVQSEVDLLEFEVLEGYKNLAIIRNSLDRARPDAERTEGLAARILRETEQLEVQLADAAGTTTSRREAIERLKADLKALEEGARRLEAGTESQGSPGRQTRGFVGDGDRQYLTGLKVGGQRILLLVDVSASMLDETVVNVIRMRNMPESRKLLSEKWQRTVTIVDWLAAQLPLQSKYQVYLFNTKAWPVLAGSDGKWLETQDVKSMNEVLRGLRKAVPGDGTSLENAFSTVFALDPQPDSVILITDGLPTQGPSAPLLRKTIDGDGRLRLFERAFAKYPRAVPLSVILLPMEGDPSAPSAMWTATRRTGGSFMIPSRDWP